MLIGFHRWTVTWVFVLATGGLEVWDVNAAGAPERRSPLSWGLTGFPDLDAAKVRRPSHGTARLWRSRLRAAALVHGALAGTGRQRRQLWLRYAEAAFSARVTCANGLNLHAMRTGSHPDFHACITCPF
jgi:hypothetical protein